jgi:CYTH domain-containing protein
MDVWTPETIVSIIVQISLALSTIVSLVIGITTAIRSAKESEVSIKRLDADIKRSDTDIEMQEVEITSRLQQIAKGLVDDLRYELDIWKGKVMELDEQLQMQKEANRRFKYCAIEVIRIVNNIIKKTDDSTIGEIREELTELESILNQLSHEFNL